MIDLELCAEKIEALALAEKYSFKRIELCSALEIGGLTPSAGMVSFFTSNKSVEIHTMIRPRGGNFSYSDSEVEIMLNDIKAFHQMGVHGVVFGCLDDQNNPDRSNNEQLINYAKKLGLEVTFHRAFDLATKPFAALNQLIEFGFDRVLTSGQMDTAEQGIALITNLVEQAKGQIQIMAGSGVNASNANKLAATGINALHFTARKNLEDPSPGMGSSFQMDEGKILKIIDQLKTVS